MGRERDERAFMRAIIDDPDDDGPRLVFADWIEEHVDPDWALAVRRSVADPGRTDWVRLHGLWWPGGPDSTPPLQNDAFDRVGVRRGFVEAVECTLAQWLEGGPMAVRAQPVTRVTLGDYGPIERYGRWSLSKPDYRNPMRSRCSRPIASFLPRPTKAGWINFRSREAARAAQSAACIAWARWRPAERLARGRNVG
jgi:uncharacterized protein (TIGR02996 family)